MLQWWLTYRTCYYVNETSFRAHTAELKINIWSQSVIIRNWSVIIRNWSVVLRNWSAIIWSCSAIIVDCQWLFYWKCTIKLSYQVGLCSAMYWNGSEMTCDRWPLFWAVITLLTVVHDDTRFILVSVIWWINLGTSNINSAKKTVVITRVHNKLEWLWVHYDSCL